MISGTHPQQTAPAAKLPQYLITLAVTTVVFAGGTVIGWSSPALPELMSPNSTLVITPHQGSWIGSLLNVGAFVGALPAGSLADLIGRKTTIMIMAIPQLLSWILIYFAQSANMLYVGRLIGGLGLGALSSTAPMYVAEIAEDSIRGALGSAFQFMLVVGILYTYILGAVVHYTLLPILCGVINIIFLIVFFRAPESPVYLLKKGRQIQAEAALRVLRGPDYNVCKELNLIEKSLSESSAQKLSFVQALGKRANLLAMIICLGMMVFQQLSGINIVIFYSGTIFKDAGSSLDPAIATIIVGLSQVVSTVVSASLIDKAGRKILLQFSGTVMAICLTVLGYYFHLKTKGSDVSSLGMMPLVSVVLYILVFAVGFGPIPWMICGEMLSPEIKGPGTGIACAMNWLLAFAVTKAFQPLSEAVGPAGTYWIFAVICVIGFFFVTFVVVETKGKSISEIQEMLSGRKKRTGNNVV